MNDARILALDGLRGLAILLVLASHIDRHWYWFGGPVGVSLFFVLSGYLITRILIRQPTIDFKAFYLRRVKRLLPALVLVVCGATLLSVVLGDDGWQRRALVALSYTASFVVTNQTAEPMGNLFHTWSLAVEEHFYLLWPVVLTVTRKRMIIGLLAVAALLWRLDVTLATDFWERVAFGSDTNAFAILVGCFVASGRLPRPSRLAGILSVVFLIVLAAIPSHSLTAVVGGYLGVFAGAIAVHSAAKVKWLEWRWLRWFGTISYGLYLWHVPLLQPIGQNKWMMLPVAIGLAWVSWRLVEKPILDWVPRSIKQDQSSAAAAAVPQPSAALNGRID